MPEGKVNGERWEVNEDFASDGDDAGIRLVGLALPFEAGNHAVEPFDTLLLLAKFDEDDTNLGLGAQRLGLLALLPAKVGLLGGPTQALLIVITQP